MKIKKGLCSHGIKSEDVHEASYLSKYDFLERGVVSDLGTLVKLLWALYFLKCRTSKNQWGNEEG